MDENIAEFDAALRNLATYCEFGGTLEEALRDLFVCGVRNEATKHKLLTEQDLTYQNALEIAKGMEATKSNSISLKTRELSVNRVLHRAPPGTERKTCYRCGIKQAIFQVNAILRMHIVILVARRGILLRCASLPTVGRFL